MDIAWNQPGRTPQSQHTFFLLVKITVRRPLAFCFVLTWPPQSGTESFSKTTLVVKMKQIYKVCHQVKYQKRRQRLNSQSLKPETLEKNSLARGKKHANPLAWVPLNPVQWGQRRSDLIHPTSHAGRPTVLSSTWNSWCNDHMTQTSLCGFKLQYIFFLQVMSGKITRHIIGLKDNFQLLLFFLKVTLREALVCLVKTDLSIVDSQTITHW